MKKPWFLKYILQTGLSQRLIKERFESQEELIQRYKAISATGCDLVGFGMNRL